MTEIRLLYFLFQKGALFTMFWFQTPFGKKRQHDRKEGILLLRPSFVAQLSSPQMLELSKLSRAVNELQDQRPGKRWNQKSARWIEQNLCLNKQSLCYFRCLFSNGSKDYVQNISEKVVLFGLPNLLLFAQFWCLLVTTPLPVGRKALPQAIWRCQMRLF